MVSTNLCTEIGAPKLSVNIKTLLEPSITFTSNSLITRIIFFCSHFLENPLSKKKKLTCVSETIEWQILPWQKYGPNFISEFDSYATRNIIVIFIEMYFHFVRTDRFSSSKQSKLRSVFVCDRRAIDTYSAKIRHCIFFVRFFNWIRAGTYFVWKTY